MCPALSFQAQSRNLVHNCTGLSVPDRVSPLAALGRNDEAALQPSDIMHWVTRGENGLLEAEVAQKIEG